MLILLTMAMVRLRTEASRQTDKQLPSTGEKTNRGLFVTGLLSILSLGSFENVVQNNKLTTGYFLLFFFYLESFLSAL